MSPNSATHKATTSADNAHPVRNNGVPRPNEELNQLARRVQGLVEQVDAMPDLAARALVQDCLQSILALHGQGLAKVLQVVREAGPDGQNICDRLISDSVVRGLLLIHGLHPVNLEGRLHEALNKIRPYMESHGGNVELISLENDVARLRLQGTCKSCPSSSVTMELAVRHALEEACPDLMGFEVEGASVPNNSFKPDSSVAAEPLGAWVTLDGLEELDNGKAREMDAEKLPLIICKVNHHFFAYANMCPACGLPFSADGVKEELLGCPMGHLYDPQLAGRGVGSTDCHLNPIPLLMENGRVKVCVR